MLKTYVELEERQVQALERLSQKTKIPQSELLRQAIDFFLDKWEHEQKQQEFLKRVDKDLEEDRIAMERLAKL